MKQFILKYVAPIIPLYSIVPFLFSIVYNSLVYFGGQHIAENFYHYNITFKLDRAIPFVESFVIVYCFWYIYYVVNYILIAKEGKIKFYKFFTADIAAKAISFCFFIFFPTTTDLRPDVIGNTFFDLVLKIIYHFDAPTNLFPSIHCMVSWFCYKGIKKSTKIPKWYKILSLMFSLLIILSTLLVKQHVIIDAIGGVAIAEIMYIIGQKTQLYKYPMAVFDKISRKIFQTK